MLTINTDNATIKDVNGDVIASVRDGELVTSRDDIYPVITVGITTDGNASENSVTALWLPADSLYSVTNTDSSVSNAVNRAIAKDVTKGTGDGKFSPNVICSRAQIVTFLYRANKA